jgi:hypothetical protein
LLADQRLKLTGTVGNHLVDATHDDEPVLGLMSSGIGDRP